MTFLFTVGASTDKIQESTKQELVAIASITASDLNGDEIAQLEPGMESEVLYLMNAEQLAAMAKADHEIVKIFTLRKNGDQLEYVIDSGYNTGHRDVKISTPIQYPSEAMLKAFEGPTVEDGFVSARGEKSHRYAPITNAMDKVIGVVAVDMDARSSKKMDICWSDHLSHTVPGILSAGLIIFVFSRTMIRDIHTLIDSRSNQ
jgi:hypothetical protein